MPRRVPLDLAPKIITGQFELRSRQIGGARGWPRDHRGKTVAIAKNRAVVFGPNLSGSKTRQMHHPPEPVASARKVVAR